MFLWKNIGNYKWTSPSRTLLRLLRTIVREAMEGEKLAQKNC